MSKKKYLLLLIPVILIAAFIVMNYKPLSLVIEYYYNTGNYSYYHENDRVSYDDMYKKLTVI